MFLLTSRAVIVCPEFESFHVLTSRELEQEGFADKMFLAGLEVGPCLFGDTEVELVWMWLR